MVILREDRTGRVASVGNCRTSAKPETKFVGANWDTSVAIKNERELCVVARLLSTDLSAAPEWRCLQCEAALAEGLTGIFYVAGHTIIHRIALNVESTVVMPVDIAVRVKVFADDGPGDVGTAVDCEIG